MMKKGHTEGMLAIRDKWIIPAAHAERKIGGHIDRQVDFSTYAHIIATVQSKYHDENANIERLVACWNAFDGMPTEAILQLASIGGVQGLTNDAGDALTLLSDALEEFDDDHSKDREVADRIRSFLKGDEA